MPASSLYAYGLSARYLSCVNCTKFLIRNAMADAGKRSAIWTYFTPGADEKSVMCNVCKKSVKRGSKGNTTNMIVHLQREHRKENQERIETEERRKREAEADTMSQVFNQ